MSHCRLSYAQNRTVEDLLQKAWHKTAYRPGLSDVTVAAEAAKVLKRPVTTTNVCFVREILGWRAKATTVNVTRFTQQDVTKLEARLGEEPLVILYRNGRVRVFALEKFLNLSNGAKTRQLWKQGPQVRCLPDPRVLAA